MVGSYLHFWVCKLSHRFLAHSNDLPWHLLLLGWWALPVRRSRCVCKAQHWRTTLCMSQMQLLCWNSGEQLPLSCTWQANVISSRTTTVLLLSTHIRQSWLFGLVPASQQSMQWIEPNLIGITAEQVHNKCGDVDPHWQWSLLYSRAQSFLYYPPFCFPEDILLVLVP